MKQNWSFGERASIERSFEGIGYDRSRAL
jgi:hypothetical protein